MGPDLALRHPSARLPHSWPQAPCHKLGFSGISSLWPLLSLAGPSRTWKEETCLLLLQRVVPLKYSMNEKGQWEESEITKQVVWEKI